MYEKNKWFRGTNRKSIRWDTVTPKWKSRKFHNFENSYKVNFISRFIRMVIGILSICAVWMPCVLFYYQTCVANVAFHNAPYRIIIHFTSWSFLKHIKSHLFRWMERNVSITIRCARNITHTRHRREWTHSHRNGTWGNRMYVVWLKRESLICSRNGESDTDDGTCTA